MKPGEKKIIAPEDAEQEQELTDEQAEQVASGWFIQNV